MTQHRANERKGMVMRRAGKKSIIGGLLALSLVLAGTGYAYWTDTLNVTTRATTGDFSMMFADLGLYAQYGNETLPSGWSVVDGIGDSGYVDDSFFMRGTSDYNKIAKDGSVDAYKERQKGYNNVDFNAELVNADWIPKNVGVYTTANTKGSDQIVLEINEMYPGYAQAFRTDVLNVGSIAAKLSSIKFEMKGLECSGAAEDMLGIALYMDGEQYSPKKIEGTRVFKLVDSLASEGDYFTVGGVHFMRLSALKKLSDREIRDVIENATILCSPATDNRMDLFLAVAMDPDAEGVYTTGSTEVMANNADADSQHKSVEVSISFLWDQFNVGKDAGKPNYLVKQNKTGKR